MKFNIQRVGKVLSSILAVCMVVIASVVPVFASQDGPFQLSDYLIGRGELTENGQRAVYYSIDGHQIIRTYYQDGTSAVFGDSYYYRPSQNETRISYRVFPLGVQKSEGANMTDYGALDISDLKRESIIQIMMKYSLHIEFENTFNSGSADTSGYTNSLIHLFCYDKDGNYITDLKPEAIRSTINANTAVIEHMPINHTINTVFPKDCVYVTPYLQIGVYFPTQSARVASINVKSQPWNLTVNIDTILEGSLSDERIEAGIADIEDTVSNGFWDLQQSVDGLGTAVVDKIDDLINGEEEWNNKAQDDSEALEDEKNLAFDIMEDIDKVTSLDDLIDAGAYQPEDLEVYVNSWIGTKGWTVILDVFKPLLMDGNFTAILLMLVSFINISVLLLGR